MLGLRVGRLARQHSGAFIAMIKDRLESRNTKKGYRVNGSRVYAGAAARVIASP